MNTMVKIAAIVAIGCAVLFGLYRTGIIAKKETPSQEMPQGSYKHKCSECTFDQTSKTLDCTCSYGGNKKREKRSKKSGCDKFTSAHGTLVCE